MNPAEKPWSPLVSEYAQDADMLELIELFVGEMPDRVERLYQALELADLQAVGVLAHQLRGAGGGYGFPQITTVAREVEVMSRDETVELDALRRSVDALTELCRRASA